MSSLVDAEVLQTQIFPIGDGDEITYDGSRISWPTHLRHGDGGEMACRIAGGPTLTNPGVWDRVTYDCGVLTGYIRPGVEPRHLIMAIKQTGTIPTVMNVEAAFREFGLLPAR